jgi:hypothetical protein
MTVTLKGALAEDDTPDQCPLESASDDGEYRSACESNEDAPWDQWEEYTSIDAPVAPAQCSREREGGEDDGDSLSFPSMPCEFSTDAHRPKLEPRSLPHNACVARSVNRAEIAATPKAMLAMQSEWDGLRSRKVWDESIVREWDDVAAEARTAGVDANLGYLLGICVEKNSEQPEGHPARKFKGRVVFQGNRVVDQNWQRAVFEDLGNSPATMDASRAADCYGCSPGHCIQQADAERACIQADLKGTPCWVCLPPEYRPQAWGKFRRPVCRLIKALYGHLDAGTYWEEHCDKGVRGAGFLPAGEEWPSCYMHPGLRLLLVVYVDDFKLAGPSQNMDEGWRLLRKGLAIEASTPVGLYLGCRHEVTTVKGKSGPVVLIKSFKSFKSFKSVLKRLKFLKLLKPLKLLKDLIQFLKLLKI